MKIRSLEELVDHLGENSKIRKRELISISSDLARSKAMANERTLRSAVVFAYAHWEGFVKDASQAYIRYATYKTRPIGSYIPAFQALASRSKLFVAQGASRRVAPHLAVVNQLVDNLKQACNIDVDAAIDTESNLSSDVFENICLSIGFQYAETWSAYGPLMNDMYASRCAIAHGQLFVPSDEQAGECLRFSINSIGLFSTEVLNSASQELFLR